MAETKLKRKKAVPAQAPSGPSDRSALQENDAAELALSNEFKIAHYSASVQAWFGTKMEKDKSLLTLASGGVGLLVPLGAASSLEKLLSVSAAIFFIITIFCTLIVFEINAKLIEGVIKGDGAKEPGRTAQRLDHILVLSFLIGVVLFTLLGVARFMNR